MTDTNNANDKKLYVLTRTRLEHPDPRHPYSERETIKEYLQLRQDMVAVWVRNVGDATLYSEWDARKWYLFQTSEKEKMEPYVDPCAEGHYLDIDTQDCFLDQASHDRERRLTKLDIQVAVSCKTCGKKVEIHLDHKLEDSVWDAIDMDRTSST
jgi:hypothetical protein